MSTSPRNLVTPVLLATLLAAPPALTQARWIRTPTPPATGHGYLVHDTARDVLVSVVPNQPDLEVWEWDANSGGWSFRRPVVSPPIRYAFRLAYDPVRAVTVLFGGEHNGDRGDCWEWDGNVWRQRSPGGASPAPRRAHCMAWHGGLREVVLFSGVTGFGSTSTQHSDLWSWNGSTWTRRSATGAGPAPRNDAALAYDSLRGELLAFGGYVGNNTFDSETWIWTAAGGWFRASTVGNPSPRGWQDMAYDPVRDRIVHFGQYLLWNNDETWEWSGLTRTWTLVSTTPPDGIRRERSGLAWDATNRRVALFGGNANYLSGLSGQYGARADLFHWDGANSTWQRLAGTLPDQDPSYELAFDSGRNVLVAVGPAFQGPTWERPASGWEARVHSSSPPTRRDIALCDTGRSNVLMFGGVVDGVGLTDETWTWDGTAWTQQMPSHAPPARRRTAVTLVTTANGPAVLLFGGATSNPYAASLNDTWLWDGTDWQQVPVAGLYWPPALSDASLAFDPARGRAVLFGGRDQTGNQTDQTWEFDPGALRWSPVNLATRPAPCDEHTLTWEPNLGVVIAQIPADGTWSYDGTHWQRMTRCREFDGRRNPGMAFDVSTQRIRLLAGWRDGDKADEWTFDATGNASYEEFGSRCPGPREPALDATMPGRLGGTLRLEVASTTAHSAHLLIGLSAETWIGTPLPFDLTSIGHPGCWLQVSIDAVATPTSTAGSSRRFDLPVPNVPSLVGACFYAQGMATSTTGIGLTEVGHVFLGR